ncbi:MAG: hypothetical protein ACNA8W_16200, partial [Bradymonadaceae bacterium]
HPADLPVEGMRLKYHDFITSSPDLISFLDRLLAPHVEDRFQSAREALAALDQQPDDPGSKIEFGRGRDEKQNFFSWWVHKASTQGVSPRPKLDPSHPVARPMNAMSILEQTPDLMRIELPRNNSGLGPTLLMTAFAIGIPLVFVIDGIRHQSLGAAGFGLFFLCGGAFAMYPALMKALKKVRIEVGPETLLFETEGLRQVERKEIKMETIRQAEVVMTVRDSKGIKSTHHHIRIECEEHALDFGGHLRAAEQEFLVYEINKAITSRKE